ncbi:MAG: ATP-binding protein [Fuerstiella sp.]
MPSGSKIRIHGAVGRAFAETRLFDSPELRVAELTSSSEPEQIGVLRDRLQRSFQEFGISATAAPPQACMAIEEALANAIYHGNLELDSELKEDDACSFGDLARQRCRQPPWVHRTVHVTELASCLGLWITIRDEGVGFDLEAATRQAAEPPSLLASGRGLIMMKAFTDDLVFNARGNEVTLVFYAETNQDVRDLLKQRNGSTVSSVSRYSLS